MEGWISLHRKITEHWIWKDPIKLKCWIDILLMVNHADSKINIGMQIFECKKGQSIMSLQTWANRWGTSKDFTRNFMVLLQKDGMILLENLQKTTRITVCNYDTYQAGLHDSQTQTKRKVTQTIMLIRIIMKIMRIMGAKNKSVFLHRHLKKLNFIV